MYYKYVFFKLLRNILMIDVKYIMNGILFDYDCVRIVFECYSLISSLHDSHCPY